jgi:hypothetical protein
MLSVPWIISIQDLAENITQSAISIEDWGGKHYPNNAISVMDHFFTGSKKNVKECHEYHTPSSPVFIVRII